MALLVEKLHKLIFLWDLFAANSIIFAFQITLQAAFSTSRPSRRQMAVAVKYTKHVSGLSRPSLSAEQLASSISFNNNHYYKITIATMSKDKRKIKSDRLTKHSSHHI